ncbi:MAG: response regulator [Proteobacteria bacterium]|nr:response regulator [Pseudomonadota bacterium]
MSQVLIVDDSHSIRELLCSVLRKAGFDVTSAIDGKEGLKTARKGSYDLVITDINMPEMDGIELLGKLRKLPEYAFKPILILTTEFSQEMKQRGKDAGATGWLVKPFDPEKLIEVISRIIK